MAKEASWERRYAERARPGYVVKTKTFESSNIEDLKKEVEAYTGAQVNKYNLLGCRYSYNEINRMFSCEAKWWAMPEGRENCKVHSAGLSSETPNKLHEKVERFKKIKVPPGELIGVEYYSWGASFTPRCHQARITYYVPKKTTDA